MAAQRITIAKIGGASALALASQFRKWADKGKIDDPMEWRPDQWPASARREMDAFASELRANGHAPPVVYFCEYVDLWSMGDLFDRWLPKDGGSNVIRLLSDRVEMWCYPLPDGGALAEHLQKSLRKRSLRKRDPQEDRWFLVNLLEGILAWTGVVETGALVVVREVLGELVEDSEVAESLKNSAPWIAACSLPMTDQNEPEQFRTLRGFLSGEEPDEANYFCFSATLRIHGEDVPFDEISNRLGVRPTHIHRKGESRGPSSPPYRDDAWHFEPALPETERLERHIEALWQIVRPEVDYLKELKRRFSVNVFCSYRSNCDTAGFEVSYKCLELFTALEIPFGVSVIVA